MTDFVVQFFSCSTPQKLVDEVKQFIDKEYANGYRLVSHTFTPVFHHGMSPKQMMFYASVQMEKTTQTHASIFNNALENYYEHT